MKYSLKSRPYLRIWNLFRGFSREGLQCDVVEQGWQKKAGKRERVADVTARNGGSREQQVVDAKERSTDVKSWGNKKVALILAGRANKGPWQQATRGLARNSGGKNGRKQNERLKIPSSRHNGILSRHLRPFSLSLPSPLLSLSFLCLSFRSNSAYRTRKQIKLRVKRKIEILRFFHGITRGNDNGKVLRACQLSRKIINSTKNIISTIEICYRLWNVSHSTFVKERSQLKLSVRS